VLVISIKSTHVSHLPLTVTIIVNSPLPLPPHTQAVHVALVMGDFAQALRLLMSHGCHERVVLLTRALEEAGLAEFITAREGTNE